MRVPSVLRDLARAPFNADRRDHVRYRVMDLLASVVYPKLTYSEYGRIWMDDREFLRQYRSFEEHNWHSADRKFLLKELLGLADHLPGQTAECGAYRGASSWLICDHFRRTEKVHFLFDSFEGLSRPSALDGAYWRPGDLAAEEGAVRQRLKDCRVRFLRGWIPQRFPEVADETFCFVHIDVDLHQPTLDSLEFFYPRMVTGGVILCDDYGFATCPGARAAWDGFMRDKVEKTIHMPTGQAFLVKR